MLFGLSTIKLIVWGVAAAAIGGVLYASYNFAYDNGYRDRDRAAQAAQQRELEAHLNQVTRADADRQALARAAAEAENQLLLERKNAADETAALRRDLAAGRVRFSAPVVCRAQPASGSAAAAFEPAEARAELDPSVGTDLVAITSDGDDAIRDLNACIDRYNDVRRKVSP